DAIDEMEKALIVEPHQVAGAEPGVALGKHIAQDLLFGLALVGIAFETAAAFIGRADTADGFAGLTAAASEAEAIVIAQRRAFRIHLDDRRRKSMRQERRNAADRADPALDIVEREIAFGRRIEFENTRNCEARLEFLPDVAAQPVAARQPQPVLGLE